MLPTPFQLNLRHLRAIGAIVTHGRMGAAAALVNLSQPALTQGVTKLERQLGTTLFDRRHEGLRPTEGGRILAERSRAAFAHLAAAVRGALPARGMSFGRPELLMTAAQLHAFLSLVDAGSFSGASGHTGLTQAALHRAVRDLEQLCGVALAERSGRGLAITGPGRRLARGVRLAALEIAAAIAEIVPDCGAGTRITLGAMPLARALVLPAAISALLREDPLIAVEVREGSWRELVEPLRDGAIDLMVGALRHPSLPGLVQEALFDDQLVVIGRVGHPLGSVKTPTATDYARYSWIIGHLDTPLRHHWHALFAGSALPRAPVECGSPMVIRGLLRDSDLLTLLSRDQVAVETEAGLLQQIGPAPTSAGRSIGIVTREAWTPTRAQRRFLDLLREASYAGSSEKRMVGW